MLMHDYDAIVIGSGPNGLASAITLQQQGLSVLILEGADTIGGGMRTEELTLPGFKHDVCAAIMPLGADSPFFNTLPLKNFGLEFIYPAIAAAHPFDDGSAAILYPSVEKTAEQLNDPSYKKIMTGPVDSWPSIKNEILGPLANPRHPLLMAKFGWKALQPATVFAKRFTSAKTKAFFAGMAAHAILPLNKIATTAFGFVMLATAHHRGWPLVKGGSVFLAKALADYFISIGGAIKTSFRVRSLAQLPSARAVLFDVSPAQLLQIAGQKISPHYRSQLKKYRYGPGVFKIDWALDAPAPFTSQEARMAGTLHLGNSFSEIVASEKLCWENKIAPRPFVLFTQQSLFDHSRAPQGKHTAWAYCHVPNGSVQNMTEIIERQVERFAPGFRERILARHTMNTNQFEEYNPNYVGGDINGGSIDIGQLFTRPALRLSPYRTSAKGLYLCSASTPPGGGVHGMCGYHAARRALKDVFRIKC